MAVGKHYGGVGHRQTRVVDVWERGEPAVGAVSSYARKSNLINERESGVEGVETECFCLNRGDTLKWKRAYVSTWRVERAHDGWIGGKENFGITLINLE
jgi:hypothetical protein